MNEYRVLETQGLSATALEAMLNQYADKNFSICCALDTRLVMVRTKQIAALAVPESDEIDPPKRGWASR